MMDALSKQVKNKTQMKVSAMHSGIPAVVLIYPRDTSTLTASAMKSGHLL